MSVCLITLGTIISPVFVQYIMITVYRDLQSSVSIVSGVQYQGDMGSRGVPVDRDV